jgi:transcriptional regulator with PAS, ATPase and Fis domain
MQEIFDLIERIKDLDSTVLITGETGTGKELVARAIHYNSTRKDKPFIAVNCGALPDTLLESELFGHIKGAFTDAKSDRIGRFELANYGTIFLDEIGEASQNVQVKLLRVIETGEFEPVGSSKTKKVNVRIIAATNKDLKERIKEGKFREDLYYRLNVIRIHLPELRERSDDIPLLVEHFIEKFNEKFKKKIKKVSDEVMDILLDYPFPGNVRELENAIEHSFVHCRGTIILKEHLPEEIKKFGEITKETFSEHPSLKDAEKEVIIQALKKNNYEIGKTAKYLGISRQTLWRKMKKLGSVI